MNEHEAESLEIYLRPTWYLDSDSAEVKEYAANAIGDAGTPREKAVKLFYKVRDGLRYDPYSLKIEPEAYRASFISTLDSAYCVPKAILLTAAARASGIPSRLGFSDVRNHLTSKQLMERMKTDVFTYHGYTEFHLDGRWFKATSAFNIDLCERFGVLPLEFDGRSDSLYHQYDAKGRLHMEYVRDRGTYADLPFDEMMKAFRETYGGGSSREESAPVQDPMFDPSD